MKKTTKRAPAKKSAPKTKKPMTPAQLDRAIAEKAGLTVKQMREIRAAEETAIKAALKRDGKVRTSLGIVEARKKTQKAIKKGTPTKNPFTGEVKPHPGRPQKTVKQVKVRVAKKFKE